MQESTGCIAVACQNQLPSESMLTKWMLAGMLNDAQNAVECDPDLDVMRARCSAAESCSDLSHVKCLPHPQPSNKQC